MTAYPLTAAVLATLADEMAAAGSPGWLDDRTVGWALTSGGCALYAAALAVAHGWTVWGAGRSECGTYDPADCPEGYYGSGLCGCMAHHFYAAPGDGWLVDVYGDHDPAGIEEDAHLWAWPDEALACLLETWHSGNGMDADYVLVAAAAARAPLAEVRAGAHADHLVGAALA